MDPESSLAKSLLKLVASLAKRGWQPIFEAHGLHLDRVRSIDDLLEPLPKIDRARPGFEDFCCAGTRALEPGIPAQSLLYHALSHPFVELAEDPSSSYATIEELD